MPNGNCLECGKPILQGLTPHYCEQCLAKLGLKYDDHVQKILDERKQEEESRDNQTNVDAAFDVLLEQIEAEIDLVNRRGARAFESRDYDAARATLERAGLFIAFRDRTVALRREWAALAGPQSEAEQTAEEQTQRRDLGRLRRGLRTPEEAYYRPILQVLVELGGRAPMGQVLDRVGQLMRGVLREVDYQPLASDPDLPRWRNAAQWARNSMVHEGLLRNDSPRGIWEISDTGRQSLRG